MKMSSIRDLIIKTCSARLTHRSTSYDVGKNRMKYDTVNLMLLLLAGIFFIAHQSLRVNAI